MASSPKKPAPAVQAWKALRAFSYKPRPDAAYIDVAAGETVGSLPAAIVKDLQTNHGDPVLAKVSA